MPENHDKTRRNDMDVFLTLSLIQKARKQKKQLILDQMRNPVTRKRKTRMTRTMERVEEATCKDMLHLFSLPY